MPFASYALCAKASRRRVVLPPQHITTAQSKPIVLAVIAGSILAVSLVSFNPLTALFSCLLGWCMLAIAVSDMAEFIIPDVLSLPAIPAGLIATWLTMAQDGAEHVVLQHLAAAFAAGAGLYLIAEAYRLLRGYRGLGLGDVKLLMAAGAWTGLQGALFVVLIACFAAFGYIAVQLFVKRRMINATTALPFGAFLAPSIWLVWAMAQIAGLQG